jgi:hypothetical protein
MYSNNIFSVKYWNVVGPKLSASPGDTDYRGTTLPSFRCFFFWTDLLASIGWRTSIFLLFFCFVLFEVVNK